jgi:predicted Fe-Mo cluster-binding NifX family protein
MKIALVTDNHLTISSHYGKAKFYEIFTVEAGRVTARESIARSNQQLVTLDPKKTSDGEHLHQHDHNAMIIPISDCQVLLAGGMGMGAHFSLKEHGIQPLITDIREIQAAVDAYLNGTLTDHPERLH